jgi:putative molybdopterin biosynthesis protein
MRLLTTQEAAEYLRLKERKIYELVSDGAIPCTKVTGKWLFPKEELDRWLSSSLARPDGFDAATPLPIVGGSHDPLLEWALRESGSGLATLPEGSEAGLARFEQGGVVAAAIHLHALDDAGDANVAALQARGAFHDAVLIGFVRREQGFVVASGNPLRLLSIADVVDTKARMAMRPEGAGAQLLLLSLLFRAGLALDQMTRVQPACPTGPDIAQAIRAGRVDCGVATRAVASAAGLDFVPLTWEPFDLVMRQRDYFRPALQAFIGFMRSEALAIRAAELGGYDLAPAGAVRFAP